MAKIFFGDQYSKMFKHILQKQPDIKTAIDISVKRFNRNPNDTRLRNHKLKKRLAGKYAFSVNNDLRIVYDRIGKKTVRFLAIGGHTEVYAHQTIKK